VAKLGGVLGLGPGERVDVELAPVSAGVLDTVRAAAEEHRRLEIDYYSFGRDVLTTRVVEPWRVFNAEGQWYLEGWCQQVQGERLFRADRIRRAAPLEATFVPPEPGPEPATYRGRPEDPIVVLDLAPAARWIAERYPNEGLESRPDGTVRVTLRVSERAWLERVLLRAGRDAVVVEGDAKLGPEAARRLLARYRRAAPSGRARRATRGDGKSGARSVS
jgi:proteasome accessory factor C